jgi:bisphosphoglycerate-dependent phosphoglycerate mutase
MSRLGKLILVRHGESESNLARSFSSSPDIELTWEHYAAIRTRRCERW